MTDKELIALLRKELRTRADKAALTPKREEINTRLADSERIARTLQRKVRELTRQRDEARGRAAASRSKLAEYRGELVRMKKGVK